LPLPRRRANRASQWRWEQVAHLSERSELWATPIAARSAGHRLAQPAGSRPALLSFWLLFLCRGTEKVTRPAAQRPAKSLLLPLLLQSGLAGEVLLLPVVVPWARAGGERWPRRAKLSLAASHRASHFSLLVQRKVTKRKHTRDAIRPAAPTGALRFSRQR